MPCYSFFGLIAKNVDIFKEDIKDNTWHEINNVKDLKKTKKFLLKLHG